MLPAAISKLLNQIGGGINHKTLFNKKNGAKIAPLSGIKNSWKYEKDLIIFNEKFRPKTIRQTEDFKIVRAGGPHAPDIFCF